jgi:mono/diheme cytochrome c family protein
MFSRFFETDTPDVLELPNPPGRSDELIDAGREAYQLLECWKCHGNTGRGDGQSAPTQEDNNGFPIRPADLTHPWEFNGGGSAEDIYRTLRTGLDGTPMPSLEDALQGGIVTDDQLWGIAYYVESLARHQPVVREVVEAKRAEGELPGAPGDSAWNEVDRFWVPLVGQIIVQPRWFSPAVTGVWVQAAYDESDIVFRLSWNDRSRSPDPIWAEWRARVTEVMAPHEGDDAMPASGPMAEDSAAAGLGVPASPDAIAMWFPRSMPTGMERPYFFMGNTRNPVYMWHWTSTGSGEELLGRGPGVMDPLPGSGNGLTSEAVFDNGLWSLTFRRPLVPADTTDAIAFPTGQPVPVAFFAWDGDNGESGTRGSLSTWFFVYLTEPTSGAVFATPLVATLLTAGLGIFAVGRAQRRDRSRNGGRD